MTLPDYDQRQYERMRTKISAYERGDIFLQSLIDDLRGLLEALQDADPHWKQELLYKWGDLEVTFAVAAARAEQQGLQRVHLNDEEREFVAETVRTFDRMLVETSA